ncbi:MAG: phage major capsid protein [Piscinibacter sp.]|nr:phage major capsid protein [Piscinibacter sp.]
MEPLQRNQYWQRNDARGRAELLEALGQLKVGQRLRLADVIARVQTPATEGAEERADDAVPQLVEYTTGFIRAAEIDEETREVDLSYSSETPYARWWGTEVLGHGSGECDMSWIASGRAPLLADHDRWTQIGVVRSALIGRDRRGHARVRFGKSERAEQEMQDAKDDVRINVSVGYEIDELELVKQEGDEKTYRVTEWRPLEVSLVAIPADMTVGIGRTAEDNPPRTTSQKENPVSKEEDQAVLEKARTEARDEARKAEQLRVKEILALATRHNLREIGEKAINDGTSLELFRGLMLDELHKRGSDRPLEQHASHLDLSERDAKRFSVTRYMRSLIEKDKDLAPFEHECAKAVREAMEKVGYRGQGKGNFIPFDVMQQPLPGVRVVEGRLMIGDRVIASQRDLATSTPTAGGNLVATDLLAADFITLLRNASLVRRMGARVLGGLVGNVAIPRQTAGVTPGWVAQAGAGTEGDATFGQVTLSPKTAHAIQDVTRDLLLQGTPAVEGLIRADLIESMATQLDLVSLHGTGASNQPTGLAATAGIGSVAGGTNGAAPTWDNIVDLESQVANNNAAFGATGYLTNTKVRGKLKRTQKFSGTNGQEIWMQAMFGDDSSLFGSVNGYRAGVSNNVSSALTKGTSSGVCSAIFYGNWADLLIGEWGGAELLPDEVTQAANRIVRMHIYQTIDIAVRRAQSFAAMLDALTT